MNRHGHHAETAAHASAANALQCEALLCHAGSRDAQETGGAVVNGAISTLIAALCLSGSASYVFVTFFYALLVIVLAGACLWAQGACACTRKS